SGRSRRGNGKSAKKLRATPKRPQSTWSSNSSGLRSSKRLSTKRSHRCLNRSSDVTRHSPTPSCVARCTSWYVVNRSAEADAKGLESQGLKAKDYGRTRYDRAQSLRVVELLRWQTRKPICHLAF